MEKNMLKKIIFTIGILILFIGSLFIPAQSTGVYDSTMGYLCKQNRGSILTIFSDGRWISEQHPFKGKIIDKNEKTGSISYPCFYEKKSKNCIILYMYEKHKAQPIFKVATY